MQKQHTNNRRFNKNNNRPHYNLDPLVVEALEFINKHQDNCCCSMRGSKETFGKTKKHDLDTTNFSRLRGLKWHHESKQYK